MPLFSVDTDTSISHMNQFVGSLMNVEGWSVPLPELHLNDRPSPIRFLTSHVDK
jgi:hypothetical protein